MVRILWEKEDEATMLAIFTAESGLRCNAEGDKNLTFKENGVEYGTSYGVAQIRHLPTRPSPKELLDCSNNLWIARQIEETQGKQPWGAYTNGSYEKYLSLYK